MHWLFVLNRFEFVLFILSTAAFVVGVLLLLDIVDPGPLHFNTGPPRQGRF